MDAPPVNRLLQLLRQRPSDTPDPAHVSHNRASSSELNPPSTIQSDTQPATKSNTLESRESSTQPATESDIQPARQSNIQPVPKGSRQPVRSSTQPATESDIQPVHKGSRQTVRSSTQPATESDISHTHQSNILSATNEDISLAVTVLSKGQQRVLQFLLSNRDLSNYSRTTPIGYDAMSKHCFLSRSGSRKVIGELCQRGLITRLETKRGETQGSVYHLESIILYATQSGIRETQKSSTLSAMQNDGSCSSSKELLLQDLILEGAFQALHP